MDELDLEDFKHGGVNITGFRLVDPEFKKLSKVQVEWSKLNSNFWRGAGTDKKIKVSKIFTIFIVVFTVSKVGLL